MLLAARILTGLLALIALATGAKGSVGGLTELEGVSQVLDNTFRYYAGIWAGVGVGLVYCVIAMPEATQVLRVLMLAVVLGGIARMIGLRAYEVVEAKTMVAIAIEIVVPIAVVGLQALGTASK